MVARLPHLTHAHVLFLFAQAGAWNDITAAAYSIMRSIKGDDSKYAVWRFSNYPEPLGAPVSEGGLHVILITPKTAIMAGGVKLEPRGRELCSSWCVSCGGGSQSERK